MPVPVYAYRELEGVCYDALKMLHDNNTRGAYNLLANKLLRMQRYEKELSYKLIWDTPMESKEDAMQDVSSEIRSSEEVQPERYDGVMSELSGSFRSKP